MIADGIDTCGSMPCQGDHTAEAPRERFDGPRSFACITSGTRGGAPASRMRPRKLVRGLIDRDAGPSPSSWRGLDATSSRNCSKT